MHRRSVFPKGLTGEKHGNAGDAPLSSFFDPLRAQMIDAETIQRQGG
jgi:hypothetical protein